MSNRSRAQQERRSRERAAAEAMSAAASIPDDVTSIAFEPEPDSGSSESAPAPRDRDDDRPLRSFEVGNKERASAMDELVRTRQERQEAELRDQVPEETRADDITAAAEAPEENAAVPQPATAAPAVPEMVKVKIDGEESEVPKSEVDAYGGINPYQMHKAAERRLVKAKEAEHKMTSLLRQVEERMRPAEPVQPKRSPAELIQDAVSKIQLATPEEGAQALAAVLETLKPQQIDPQTITYQTITLMRATEAEDRFVAENKDLVENPLLKNLVIQEKQRRLLEYKAKQQLPNDWNQFYTGIANDIRAAIGRPAIKPTQSAQPSQSTSGSVDREARKASITALPTASQRATLPEEQKPPTRGDLLAEMRKARGQPV